jgi:hypothetical protein
VSQAARGDVDAYRRLPSTVEEQRIAEAFDAGLEDDMDWEALYAEMVA